MSPKDSLNRVFASAPLDGTAARVTARSGDHYDPEVNFANHLHSDTPIPTKPIPKNSLYSCADLIGKQFGRMTVIGLAAEQNPKKKARWVVRCACGAYEIRKAPAIRNPLNTSDCCQKCQCFELAKKRYARLGARPVKDFTKKDATE